jgi:hypothetical protein
LLAAAGSALGAGSLVADPGLLYTAHRLAWAGSPGLGEPVTLTCAVTVTTLSCTALWNRIALTQTDTATALVSVDPLQIHLPVILRRFP